MVSQTINSNPYKIFFVLTRVTACAKVRVDTLLSFHNLKHFSTGETEMSTIFLHKTV